MTEETKGFEDRCIKTQARNLAFNTCLIVMRLQNAALVGAMINGFTKEDFLKLASEVFEGTISTFRDTQQNYLERLRSLEPKTEG